MMEMRDQRHLAIEVVSEGAASIMRMRGEIDGTAATMMNAGYDEAEEAGSEVVVLDFTGVEYINSTGIALIVGVLARARAAKRRLIACGLSEHYVEIFSITRLSDFMNLFPDVESAVEEASQEKQTKAEPRLETNEGEE